MTHPRFLLLGLGLTSCFNAARGLEAKDVLAYSFGKTTFQPRVNITSTYSDNIAYNNNLRLSDVTMSIAPGLGVMYGTPGENLLTAGYQLEQVFYLENDQFNALNHAFQMAGHFEASRLSYDGSASVQHLSTLVGGLITDPLLFGSSLKTGRFVYTTTHMFDYSLGEKTGIYAGPSYDETDYDEGTPLFDQNTIAAVAGFRYSLTAKTSLFGEMRYGQSAVGPNRPGDPKGPSSSFLSGSIGAKFDFSARISGTVKVGYETRSFSNDAPAPSEPVVGAAVTYVVSQKSSATATYSRFSASSIQAASETGVTDSLALGFTQQIGNTGKFGANAGVAYQTVSYVSSANTGRTDDYISGTIGFFYNFQLWLKSSLTYSHTQSTSTLANVLEHTENRVALVISVGY